MGVTNFDEYRDVFVVADTIDDVVHPVTYELIGQARRIAKELGQLENPFLYQPINSILIVAGLALLNQ